MKKKKRFNPGGLKFRNEMLALALLAPTIALFVLFKYYPIISGVFISFFKINIVKLPGDFCGFDNYIRAFRDARFYTALFNNLKHFVYIMAMNFWCPILLAILVDETRKSKGIFRLLYFIPSVAPAIVMTLLWKYFWQPDYGLANFLLGKLGVGPKLWLNDKALVYFCMYFPNLVIVGGMQLVYYLAALQDIPQELYEAALVDGAGIWQRVRYVTLPGIKNIIFTFFLLQIINSFNICDNVMVLTGGGPGGSTESMILYAFKQATESMDYSYAITMASIVFFITMFGTMLANKITKKLEE